MEKKKAIIFSSMLIMLAAANGYLQGVLSSKSLGIYLTVSTTILLMIIMGVIVANIFKEIK